MTSPTEVETSIPGLAWPALATTQSAPMFALAAQLAHSERASPIEFETLQREQLAALLRHTAASVPFYRDRLAPLVGKRKRIEWSRWDSLPLLRRADIQTHYRALASQALPASHGQVRPVATSGSTGTPLQTVESALQQMYFGAMHIRKYRWHNVRYDATFAATRLLAGAADGQWAEKHGTRWRPGVRTGPMHALDIRAPIDYQATWLMRYRPHYLTTYASNLAALLDHIEELGLDFSFLEQVHSIGEVVEPVLRDRCNTVLGIPIVDAYTTTELGVISLQAPHGTHHHVMSETHLVEILRHNGEQCAPGEIGRVVVTPLHNFAMPLLRYETGDYAEAGDTPTDGIRLPTLARITGRTRNMAMRPDGSRFWPAFDSRALRAAAPLRQIQFEQTSATTITVRIVPERRFTTADEQALSQALTEAFRARFTYAFDYVEVIERGAGGKYEEFVCVAQA